MLNLGKSRSPASAQPEVARAQPEARSGTPRSDTEHSDNKNRAAAYQPRHAAGRPFDPAAFEPTYDVRKVVHDRRAAEDETHQLDLAAIAFLISLSGPATTPMPIPPYSLAPDASGNQPGLLALLKDPALRGAIFLMLSAVLAGGLGFVYWAFNTHSQNASALGSVSAEVSSITFLAIAGSLNLTSVFARFIPEAGWSARRMILGSYGAAALAGLVSADIFLLTPLATDDVLGGRAGRIAFVLFVVVNSIFNIQDGGLIGFGRFGLILVENVLVALSRLALLPLVTRFLSGNTAVLWSWALPMTVAVLAVNIYMVGPVAGRQRQEPRLPAFRELGRLVAIDSVTTAIYAAVGSFLPALVTDRLGSTEGGYFYVPWIITTMVTLLLMNISISMVREVVTSPEKARSTILRSMGLIAIVVICVMVTCMVLFHLVLAPLGPSYSVHGAGLLRWVGLAAPATAVTVLFWAICLVRRHPWPVFAVNLSTSAAIVAGVVLLPPGTDISHVGIIFCIVQWAAAIALIGPTVKALRVILKTREE